MVVKEKGLLKAMKDAKQLEQLTHLSKIQWVAE